jgi:hypothetical protein
VTLLVDQDTYPSFQGNEGLTIQILAPTIRGTSVVNSIVPTPDTAAVAFMGDVHQCFNGVVSYPCPLHFKAPVNGTYTLQVTPTGPVTGSVRLRLYVFYDVTVSTTLGNVSSPSIPINLVYPGQNALIHFTLSPGTSARPSFTFTGGSFSGLTGQLPAGISMILLDPAGNPLGGGCCAAGPYFTFAPGTASAFINYGSGFGIGTAGVYTLWVQGINDTTGTLNLNVYDAADVNLNVAADGSSNTINLDAPGQRAFANFPATQGQRLFGVVSNITGFSNPANLVSLLEQPGFLFFPFQAGSKIFLSPNDGSYRPLVMPGPGTDQVEFQPVGTDVGSATLTLYTVPPDVTGSLGTPVTTTTPGQKASIPFFFVPDAPPNSGNNQGLLQITVTGGTYPQGECLVTVVAPDGSPWSQPHDCSGSGQTWTVPLDGPASYNLFIDPLQDAVGTATFQVMTVPGGH